MSGRRIRPFIAAIAAIVAGIVLLGGPDAATAGSTGAVGPIDTTDRLEVAASYADHILENLALPAGWTGSVADCAAGTTDHGFDVATIEAVNWFRRMAGLGPVGEDAAASAVARETALMMEAAGSLSHDPDAGWPCHTAAGATGAGRSNLTLGIAGPRGVIGQIQEPGAGNEPLGHRRWLLFPRLAEVGVGNTNRVGVLHVIGPFGSRDSTPQWIAWPPSGFVPDAMIFDRWSLSYSSAIQADFSSARVSMTENGRPIPVDQYPVANGYGDNTIAWEPIGIDPTSPGDHEYEVTITGVGVGDRRVSYSYSVMAFDPHAPAPASDGVEVSASHHQPLCRGREATIVGSDAADTLVGTAGNDVIVGLGGNDVIHGGGGNDVICSGAGHDRVYAGDGADIVLGGPGRDTLHGGAGRDVLNGQNGRDRLAGHQGRDVLSGGGNVDVIAGNSGRDTCWAMSATIADPNPADTFRACERVG